MEELKKEATELGLDFKGNISKAELTKLIEDAKNQNADGSSEEEVIDLNAKVKVRITPRDSEEKEGFVGWGEYKAQYQFDEDIEMPIGAVEFLKTRGGYVYSANGSKKWQSRFIIEMV